MADEKWIAGLAGDMPVFDAARHALTVRLGVVRERLPLTLAQADDDSEHVHQLRVGTRRAVAALRIFADVLPAKFARKTRKRLRTVRRAAGAARDWDVFLEMVAERLVKAEAKQQRGLDLLVGVGLGQRQQAQAQLLEELPPQEERLAALVAELDAAEPPVNTGRATLRDLAVPTLTQLRAELDAAANGDLLHYEALHRVRILGKQLRYSMELFASCFGPAFRNTLYPAIVAMQDILGLANDSHVAVGRLVALRGRLVRGQPDLWPQYRLGLDALIRSHQRRLPQQRKRFEKWWAAWQTSDLQREFEALLHAAPA